MALRADFTAESSLATDFNPCQLGHLNDGVARLDAPDALDDAAAVTADAAGRTAK